ncbi:MAG: efflux RND transporter periplasmic adaptor subunit [Spirochaetaceae bacterium]|nr:efflux RND transporter periplasmic adaptor subunit [Spirochaetaceae bacterium]
MKLITKNRLTVFLIFLIMVTLVLMAFHVIRNFLPAQTSVRKTSAAQEQPGGNGAPGVRPGAAGNGASGAGPGAGGNGGGTAVRLTEVTLGTVENSLIVNGDVLSSSQVSLYPSMPGKLTELRVRPGDRVNRGQVIALVDPSRPGDPFFPNPVTSTVSGAVLSVPANVGDTLESRTVICVVGNLSELKVETYVPERYSVFMRRGLPAQISFEAMGDEQFPAEVDELSPVLDPASRTMRIRLRFVSPPGGRPDPRIMAGMFATVSLVTNTKVDVPVIPRDALINTYGSWIVFVVPPGSATARRREISLGLESEAMVEVLSGLEPGEPVVIAGQNFLTDGDPVRVVE